VAQVMEIAAILPDAPHWPQAAYLDALNPDSAPRRIALVAAGTHPGTVQGFAVASLLPPQAELESIAVASHSQREGLGRKLVNALAEELRRAGVREIWLELRASNRTARGFYRSLGFAETGRRKGYYADPIDDAVLMSLNLE
jgi:[ribosomal protein S18]-alanine N-acetyltransferase